MQKAPCKYLQGALIGNFKRETVFAVAFAAPLFCRFGRAKLCFDFSQDTIRRIIGKMAPASTAALIGAAPNAPACGVVRCVRFARNHATAPASLEAASTCSAALSCLSWLRRSAQMCGRLVSSFHGLETDQSRVA
jgi:hypothetical protein